MQYVDYQHMIVNEINEIYLVLILFTCIYKYHIFKLFPISYELSYKPIFSKQQCILISDLQITYTVQLTNSFEKSLIYLIYIQRLILIFQISFIFFFYQIPQVNLLHVPVYNCNFFFRLYRYQHYAHRIFSWRHVLCLYTYSQHHI